MADPELLAILRRGPEAWNRHRLDTPEAETPDLSRADLAGLDLREADLHGANLTGANLTDTKLEGAVLTDGQLAQVEATAARFDGATMHRARLTGAQLSESSLIDADLTGSDLTRAHLVSARLRRANLSGVQLQMANASRAVLDGAQLPVANLKGAVFSAASLEGAKLPGANLEGARLPMANLRDADLTRSEASHAHLPRVILYDANLTGASLGSAELMEADLSGAQLPLADLEGARLQGGRLGGADLSQVNLKRACLKGADFSKADLTGASLVEAELVRTNFGGAKLARCQFSRALVVDCNLEQAVLKECRLDEVTLSGIRHEGAVTANLALTPTDEASILVDDLEMVKLMETLLTEPRWRELFAPNALRVVLVLGRFPEWRHPHLDAVRDLLRKRDYAPVAIDLENPVGPKLRSAIENLALPSALRRRRPGRKPRVHHRAPAVQRVPPPASASSYHAGRRRADGSSGHYGAGSVSLSRHGSPHRNVRRERAAPSRAEARVGLMKYRTFDSPFGRAILAGDGDALTWLNFVRGRHADAPYDGWVEDRRDPVLREASAQLRDYFKGERQRFDVPLDPGGTPFQKRVWKKLVAIPFGKTVTYSDLARRVGRPAAFRAVGAANGQNPISILIPCHRVVGKDGSLTGYGGGLETKRGLLDLEQCTTGKSSGR